MTVTINDVRLKLNNLSDDLVTDGVIQLHIDKATAYVNAIKNDDADETYVDNAILAKAALDTYMSYAMEIERATGTLPHSYPEQVDNLREEFQRWLRLITDEYQSKNAVVAIEPCSELDY